MILKPVYIKHTIANILPISKIVTIHYLELAKDFAHEGESHDFWEMVYADKGEILSRAGAKSRVLHPGEAIFHKPNEYHSIRADGVTAPNVFIISFVSRAKAMDFADILHFDNAQYFSKTFKRVTGMTPKEYAASVKAD